MLLRKLLWMFYNGTYILAAASMVFSIMILCIFFCACACGLGVYVSGGKFKRVRLGCRNFWASSFQSGSFASAGHMLAFCRIFLFGCFLGDRVCELVSAGL